MQFDGDYKLSKVKRNWEPIFSGCKIEEILRSILLYFSRMRAYCRNLRRAFITRMNSYGSPGRT